MVRTRRRGGNNASAANLALCKSMGSTYTKKYLTIVRSALIEYLIDNPSRLKCAMNSNQIITEFVRAETAKKSAFSNLYWKATQAPRDRLVIRWILDRIRTDNEFRTACATGDKAKMTIVMDEYIRKFKEHACDTLDPARYSGPYGRFIADPNDIVGNTHGGTGGQCLDLGYRVQCGLSFGGRRKTRRSIR